MTQEERLAAFARFNARWDAKSAELAQLKTDAIALNEEIQRLKDAIANNPDAAEVVRLTGELVRLSGQNAQLVADFVEIDAQIRGFDEKTAPPAPENPEG